MKLLLDTHVWIWAAEGARALGRKCRKLLVDPDTQRWISPLSTLEIARLVARKESILACPLSEWIARSMTSLKLQTAGVEHPTAMEACALPSYFHSDSAPPVIGYRACTRP